jgi:Ca2+-binding EF-hand superfamily protein
MSRLPLSHAALALATAASIAVALPVSAREGGDGRHGGGPRAEMLFERFDLDGDGRITEAEVEDAAAQRFAEADANGDGQLSAEELVAAAEARRVERQAARIDRMIERLDGDGDGLLSPEEIAERRDGALFERLDADDDGVITEDELAEMRPGRWGRGPGPRHGGGDRD